jgi:hypothetical protein
VLSFVCPHFRLDGSQQPTTNPHFFFHPKRSQSSPVRPKLKQLCFSFTFVFLKRKRKNCSSETIIKTLPLLKKKGKKNKCWPLIGSARIWRRGGEKQVQPLSSNQTCGSPGVGHKKSLPHHTHLEP